MDLLSEGSGNTLKSWMGVVWGKIRSPGFVGIRKAGKRVDVLRVSTF